MRFSAGCCYNPVPSPGGKRKDLRDEIMGSQGLEGASGDHPVQSLKRWCEVIRALAKHARNTQVAGEEATVV